MLPTETSASLIYRLNGIDSCKKKHKESMLDIGGSFTNRPKLQNGKIPYKTHISNFSYFENWKNDAQGRF